MESLLLSRIEVLNLTKENFEEKCRGIQNLDTAVFKDICKRYGFPDCAFTLIVEKNYTDKLYRDIYYNYYSTMHFEVPRVCQRLLIFKGTFSYDDFLANDVDKDRELIERREKAFIGTIVVRPPYIRVGASEVHYTMSRTLLDPNKAVEKNYSVRTAKFEATSLGHTYKMKAFPFTNQHGDIMKCAETCLWELTEYYGTKYNSYHTILPSDIYRKISKHSTERVLPSLGLDYQQISSILQEYGFETQVYCRNVQVNHREPQIAQEFFLDQDNAVRLYSKYVDIQSASLEVIEKLPNDIASKEYRYLFHYYVASGFPLIVNISDHAANNTHHAVIVIGYTKVNNLTDEDIVQREFLAGSLYFIDSAEFCEKYVIIDDNCIPYSTFEFDKFSKKQNGIVDSFIVSLPKHLYLDAEKAASNADILLTKLFSDKVSLVLKQLDVENSQSNPLVLHYCLVTAKGIKRFRAEHATTKAEKLFYTNVEYPRFVWLAEFSPKSWYQRGKVFGEIIIDATASTNAGVASMISLRIGRNGFYRLQDENVSDMFARHTYDLDSNIYELYQRPM